MSDDRIILTPIVASLVAIMIAYVKIWSTIKNQQRESLNELKENNEQIKRDLKDYVNIRLRNLDLKIENITKEIRQMRDWLQKVEDKSNRDH